MRKYYIYDREILYLSNSIYISEYSLVAYNIAYVSIKPHLFFFFRKKKYKLFTKKDSILKMKKIPYFSYVRSNGLNVHEHVNLYFKTHICLKSDISYGK